MKLIVTHDNADFDGLAACVAVAKLHPGAVLGLATTEIRPVQRFLALHRDWLEPQRVARIDPEEVELLIVVDVRDRRRLRHVKALLERDDLLVHVWDHHPATEHDVVGVVEQVAPLGAVTTLAVEHLERAGVEVDPEEATLFALGIHADTASLTSGHTTPRDARAVAWLLERGARLPVLNRYLEPALTAEQRTALSEILEVAEPVDDSGRVRVASIERHKHVDGLAEVVSEALRLSSSSALFVVCALPRRDRVEVIGRARGHRIDVGAALRPLGGGGHAGAGAAVLKKTEPADARARLEAAIADAQLRPTRVRDVMSSPADSVEPTLSLRELASRLDAWGYSGVPVVRDGEVLGVVSRRDVARAERSDNLDLPVSSHMSGDLLTTSPDTPLEDALRLMTDANVGRLPVLRGGRLVGIVSRTDARRELYGPSSTAE